MLSIKPKIASTIILEDVLAPTTISGQIPWALYRSNQKSFKSFLGPVKSYTVSPMTRHRCDIFSEFEAVLPRRSAAKLQPSLHASVYNTQSIMKFRFFLMNGFYL